MRADAVAALDHRTGQPLGEPGVHVLAGHQQVGHRHASARWSRSGCWGRPTRACSWPGSSGGAALLVQLGDEVGADRHEPEGEAVGQLLQAACVGSPPDQKKASILPCFSWSGPVSMPSATALMSFAGSRPAAWSTRSRSAAHPSGAARRHRLAPQVRDGPDGRVARHHQLDVVVVQPGDPAQPVGSRDAAGSYVSTASAAAMVKSAAAGRHARGRSPANRCWSAASRPGRACPGERGAQQGAVLLVDPGSCVPVLKRDRPARRLLAQRQQPPQQQPEATKPAAAPCRARRLPKRGNNLDMRARSCQPVRGADQGGLTTAGCGRKPDGDCQCAVDTGRRMSSSLARRPGP